MRRYIPFLATQCLRPFARFFPDLLWRRPAESGKKILYLTFDDGPTPTMTVPLLELLDRYQALATFFLIGAHAEAYPDLVHRLVDAGHTIGNHTYRHPDAWRTPAEDVCQQLTRTTKLLEDLNGHPIRYMRPPYGHFTRSMRDWCQANAQHLTMWDVMPGDFLPTATPKNIACFTARTIIPGSIVVLHDNPIVEEATLPALRILLPLLRADGWQFEAL